MAEREYIRLTRPRLRRKSWFMPAVVSTRSSLWLGKDHLLVIDSTRFAEEYKRFYFRDIQAFTIRKTKRRRRWNFVLALLLLFWLPAAIIVGIDATISSLYGAWLLFLGAPLLINNILGPSCTVYIRTAVQTEELPSLNRIRRAAKALDRIRPLITAA